MRSTLSTRSGNQISNRNEFNESRGKITFLFENQQLKDAIREFYHVQQEFHHNMALVVNAFTKTQSRLPARKRYLLTELLSSYRTLAQNLFHEPIGDVEEDIDHIMQVIDIKNEQFKRALLASINSISNVDTFHKLLKEFQQDEQLANHVKEQFNCKSWLLVEGSVEYPFQNLIRYEMLLKSIQKNLAGEGYPLPESILTNMSKAIAYLVAELTHVNDNKEILLLLNNIERVLNDLLAALVQDEEIQKLSDICLREQIEFVIVTLKTGKNKIIQHNQDVCSLYHGLLDLLNGLEHELTKRFQAESKATFLGVTRKVAWIGYSLISLSSSVETQENQPAQQSKLLSKLKDLIKELNETYIQTESLKSVYENLIKKNGK